MDLRRASLLPSEIYLPLETKLPLPIRPSSNLNTCGFKYTVASKNVTSRSSIDTVQHFMDNLYRACIQVGDT